MANGIDFSGDPIVNGKDDTRPKSAGKDDTRPKSAGKDDTRPKSAGKGPGDGASGPPNEVAQDIFRRVTGLGGFLVVAFVAPIAPSQNGTAADSPSAIALNDVGVKAVERENEAAAIDREVVQSAVQALKHLATSQGITSRQSAKRTTKR